MKKGFHTFIRNMALGLLVFAMILPVASYAAKEEPSKWAKPLVDSAIKKGYVPERFQSEYKKSITKLEMAQLFTAYLEYLTGDKVEDIIRKSRISNAKKGMMNDTSDRAAELMIALDVLYAESSPRFDMTDELIEKGVFNGSEDINKGLGAYYFGQLLRLLGAADSGDLNTDSKSLEKFKDLTNGLATDDIAIMVNHGLMSGSGAKFSGEKNLTREQVISILEKIDRSELKNSFGSYFNSYSPRTGSLYPNQLDSLPNAIQFPYRGRGAAYLFSIGKGNDGWHKEMTLKLPGQRQDIALDNRDLYGKNWSFETGLQLADALADEDGNVHIALISRTALFKEELEQSKVPMLIIRSYSPSGKTLSTHQIFAKNISGLKNLGRFADYGSFEMEYKNGKYEISAIAENIGRTERRAVAMTVNGNNASAKYLLDNPKAMVRKQDRIYSEVLGGYVYVILANEGQQRGFNLVMPDGKVYQVFHIWQKPNFKLKNSDGFDKDLHADLGGIVETGKGLMLVGAANREISAAALKGNRDVFIQVADKKNPTSFLGGEERVGTSNLPTEKPVADKGVIWLTKLAKDEIALDPKLVKMGENVVVLWNVRPFLIKEDELRFPYEKREVAYYAIVGPDGKILREATRLPKFTILGRSDMPVEYKDSLYWVAGGLNGVRFVEFKPMMKGKK